MFVNHAVIFSVLLPDPNSWI